MVTTIYPACLLNQAHVDYTWNGKDYDEIERGGGAYFTLMKGKAMKMCTKLFSSESSCVIIWFVKLISVQGFVYTELFSVIVSHIWDGIPTKNQESSRHFLKSSLSRMDLVLKSTRRILSEEMDRNRRPGFPSTWTKTALKRQLQFVGN